MVIGVLLGWLFRKEQSQPRLLVWDWPGFSGIALLLEARLIL
jgi:hypothetical protein